MAGPTLVGVSTGNSGTGNVDYDYPRAALSGAEFLLAVIEDANGGVTPTPTPSGWTIVSGTPNGTGTAGGTAATAIRAYYKRMTLADASAMTLGDLGDHQAGIVFAFSGVDRTNPFDTAAVTDTAAASTSVTFPSITTATADSLVLCIVANATDTTTAQGSSFAHAGLSGVASGNFNAVAGNGGGVSYLYGTAASAGATGTGSCTLATSSVQARLTIALRAEQAATADVSKLTGYALTGGQATALSVSKLMAYAVIGPSLAPPVRPAVFVVS